MLILRNVKIQAQQNYLPKPLPHAEALRHKSFTSSENKEVKKLSESRTTLRNNSKTLERCEKNFVWHFWREKSEIRFWCWSSAKKNMVHFEGYRTSLALKCFNSAERCLFWQIFCIILIFFRTIESEESISDCKFCNRLFLNQQDRQQLAPSQMSAYECCKYICRSFWQYCIALAYQGVFLPDIATYRHRRNWTSWTYHMCWG